MTPDVINRRLEVLAERAYADSHNLWDRHAIAAIKRAVEEAYAMGIAAKPPSLMGLDSMTVADSGRNSIASIPIWTGGERLAESVIENAKRWYAPGNDPDDVTNGNGHG